MTVAELERAIALDESGLDPDTIPLPVEEFPFATAAPVVVVAPFTGTQYTVGILKIRPSELRREAAVFVLLLAYLALSLYGKQHARQEATRWFTTAKPLLDSEFSSLGLSKDESLIQDGGDKFVGFATGRRGVESATIIVQTVAYHDIFKIAYHFIREIADPNYRSGANTITLDFLLRDPVGTPGAKFVFAVASKLGLQALRTTRYDLVSCSLLLSRSTFLSRPITDGIHYAQRKLCSPLLPRHSRRNAGNRQLDAQPDCQARRSLCVDRTRIRVLQELDHQRHADGETRRTRSRRKSEETRLPVASVSLLHFYH